MGYQYIRVLWNLTDVSFIVIVYRIGHKQGQAIEINSSDVDAGVAEIMHIVG